MITWLASYPRSGNTFLRIILNSSFNIKTCSLHDDRFDIGADGKVSDLVGHEFLPADFDIGEARRSDEMWFIKTHGEPVNNEDRCIYLVRDGRECSVSFARYLESFIDKQKTLRDVIYGNTIAGTWGGHLEAWQPATRANCLLIRFEDLVDDPAPSSARLSEFLQQDASAGDLPGFEELQKVNPKFFSSGQKDSWKENMPERYQLAYWMLNGQQMLEYGYDEGQPTIFKKGGNAQLSLLMADALSFNFQKARNRDKRVTKLNGIIDRLSVSLNASNRRLALAEKRLEKKTRKVDEELTRARQSYREMEAGYRQLLADLKEQLARNHDELASTRQSMQRQQQELQGTIDAMKHSTSWKVGRLLTAPLRYIKDGLRARRRTG